MRAPVVVGNVVVARHTHPGYAQLTYHTPADGALLSPTGLRQLSRELEALASDIERGDRVDPEQLAAEAE